MGTIRSLASRSGKWQDVDLEAGTVQLRRTLTKSDGRLLLVEPKTAKGRRKIKLTARATAALRVHRRRQLEERLQKAALWRDQGLVFAPEAAFGSDTPWQFRVGSRSCQQGAEPRLPALRDARLGLRGRLRRLCVWAARILVSLLRFIADSSPCVTV